MSNDITNVNGTNAYAGVNSGAPFAQGLTPDALLVYLSTRLDGLEDQINGYFAAQQRSDQIRGYLNDIKAVVNGLTTDVESMKEPRDFPENAVNRIHEALEGIKALDPKLAARLKGDLEELGFILRGHEDQYKPNEVKPTLEYLDSAIADLNSTSQLNMIHLQSLVRAHETAVSLGTNLVEAAGRITQKIADRIGG